MDIAATPLDLAGVDMQRNATTASMRGRSLLPYLEGAADEIHDGESTAGWEMFSHRALHRGHWKITWIWTPTGAGNWQLYDLSTDPAETIDLAAEHPARLGAMIAEWHAYAEETGVLPLDRDVSGFHSWQLVHE